MASFHVLNSLFETVVLKVEQDFFRHVFLIFLRVSIRLFFLIYKLINRQIKFIYNDVL